MKQIIKALMAQTPYRIVRDTHAHCFDAEGLASTRRLADFYLELAARVPVFAVTYRRDFQQLTQLTRAIINAIADIDTDAIFSPPGVPAGLTA